MNGILNNVDFVQKNFSNDTSLFIKSRIPLFVRIKNIEFRCSYRLLNNNLRNIGELIGYSKLEIDYRSSFYDFSKLPKEELDYNARDVEIMLRAIAEEFKNWEWLTNINKLPYTATSFTRKNNKYLNNKKDTYYFTSYCNYQKKFNKAFIDFIEQIFSGGYTHANSYFVGKVIQNVYSFDLISSYPATMILKQFPRFFKEFTGSYKVNYLKKLFDLNIKKYTGNYEKPFEYAFLAKVVLKKVKPRNINNNLILPISFSKCKEYLNIQLDNGRVYSADMIKICVNEVDLFNFKKFYKFEIVECERLLYTNSFSFLPQFVINSVTSYLYEKSTLKSIIAKIDKNEKICVNDFYNKEKNAFIYSDEKINNILSLENAELQRLLKTLYQKSKEKLNAQYGINVEHLLKNEICYNEMTDSFFTIQKDEIESKVFFRDFITGIYITAYARYNLFEFGHMLANNNIKLIYSDTDSWKITGDEKTIFKLLERYNKKVLKTESKNLYNIGCFDYEIKYDYFSTLGCKKYITINDNKVTSTIAGIGKLQTSESLTLLFKQLDCYVELFFNISFSPCTVYDYSVTGKLISKYKNNIFKESVIDENGKKGIVTGVNMIELCESDFILMNTSTPANRFFINHCEKLQKRNFHFEPVLIYRKDNKVFFKFLTNNEFKKLRLYEVKDKILENIVEH